MDLVPKLLEACGVKSPADRKLAKAELPDAIALEATVDIAAELVMPGGRLVYAVCSLLSREGAGQTGRFLERHSSWISEETAIPAGRRDGAGRLLTPAHDSTDGFFIARLRRPC